MATEPFRIFIGKHPCDDLPYIVEPNPDPRSPDFDPFRGIEGEDYSGWYVKEAHCPMTDTPDTLYRKATYDEINDGTEGNGPALLRWVVPVEPDAVFDIDGHILAEFIGVRSNGAYALVKLLEVSDD